MSSATPSSDTQIIIDLYNIGVIKLGKFTLKSGVTSPLYVDARRIISFPSMLRAMSTLLWQSVQGTHFDIICGVPYAALPIATCVSLDNNIPMIMRRKEKKAYGTQQQIEGHFQTGQTCLLIEDVITSGMSIIETAQDLEAAGLIVTDVAVLIDREQGARENLLKHNYTVHAALTLTNIIRVLLNSDLVNETDRAALKEIYHEHT